MKVRHHLALILTSHKHRILATWDAPPRSTENNYDSFKRAFDRFIDARNVLIPKRNRADCNDFDRRDADGFRKKHALGDPSKLELGSAPNLKLMQFQVSSGEIQ